MICSQCGDKIKEDEEWQRHGISNVHSKCMKAFIEKHLKKGKEKRKKELKRFEKVKKENSKSKAKQNAWDWFSRYIRLRDSKNGVCRCITCGCVKIWNKGIDAGHYIPKSKGEQFYFNEDNAHAQCRYCNSFRSQQDLPYRESLIEKIGLQKVERLEQMKNERSNKKNTFDDYRKLSKKYRLKFNKLKEELNI